MQQSQNIFFFSAYTDACTSSCKIIVDSKRPLILRQSHGTKKGKKAFSSEEAAGLASSDKGSFFNQDQWVQEIEEHERKQDTI